MQRSWGLQSGFSRSPVLGGLSGAAVRWGSQRLPVPGELRLACVERLGLQAPHRPSLTQAPALGASGRFCCSWTSSGCGLGSVQASQEAGSWPVWAPGLVGAAPFSLDNSLRLETSFISVLGPLYQGHSNWGFKTTESVLSALEARGPMSQCWPGQAPAGARWEAPSCPSQLLGVPGALSCGRLIPVSAALVTWPSSPCI